MFLVDMRAHTCAAHREPKPLDATCAVLHVTILYQLCLARGRLIELHNPRLAGYACVARACPGIAMLQNEPCGHANETFYAFRTCCGMCQLPAATRRACWTQWPSALPCTPCCCALPMPTPTQARCLDRALDDAAAAGCTYTNELSTTQLATAQLKLRRYCAAFWQRLEQRGLQHLMPGQVTTVVHRAAVLTEQLRAPPPSAALWAAMEGAMAKHASGMDAQGVSNCFLACAKLGRRPGGEVARRLLPAAEKASTSMEPQEVANVLWALAKLGLPVDGPPRTTLSDAVLRTSEGMAAQDVANTLWALAKLRVPMERSLRAALLAAALRTCVA